MSPATGVKYEDHDDAARDLYDSTESSQFYKIVMGDGGFNVHYGVFEKPSDTYAEASINTVNTMMRLAESANVTFDASTRVLDAGAGNGGPAHHLATTTGCHVTCLNLCAGQNDENKKRVEELGIGSQIEVVLGSFEAMPIEWTGKFDVVWSQDAFDHSNDKPRVLSQVYRCLKPGGHLVFTDIMASPMATAEDLAVFKSRLKVDNMYTVHDYENQMSSTGFTLLRTRDLTAQLLTNYRKMKSRLNSERDRLADCSEAFIAKYSENLRRNIEVLTQREAQTWYAFVAGKLGATNNAETNGVPRGVSNGVTNGVSTAMAVPTSGTGEMKIMKRYVAAKLHNIGVTHKDVSYHGSAGICRKLMKEVGIEPWEAVDVCNCRNGLRWTTYAIPEDDEGSFKLNGAAARLGELGDECIVFTFAMSEKYKPAKVVCMNPAENNKITDVFFYEQ